MMQNCSAGLDSGLRDGDPGRKKKWRVFFFFKRLVPLEVGLWRVPRAACRLIENSVVISTEENSQELL